MTTQLRFLCFGVGAIGTYLGGSLALAGQTVVFVERPEVADVVRRQGLSIDQGDSQASSKSITPSVRHLDQPQVVDSIDTALSLGPFDAAILAIKAYDTQGLIDSLKPYNAALPPIISFQNGVENEGQLAALLGKGRVIAGTVTTAVGRKGPGEIVIERLRGVGVAVNHPLGPALVEVMDGAGLHARAYSNPHAMKWSKMLTNLLANASSAILDMPPNEIFAHPGLFDMEMHQLRELCA